MALADSLKNVNIRKILLAEVDAVKLSDDSVVTLYFSTHPLYRENIQYIPCISDVPTIDRSAGGILDPMNLPDYGDLSLYITPDFKPDLNRSIEWNLLLLKDEYNFLGQQIKLFFGTEGLDFSEFQQIFTGVIGEIWWSDHELSFTVFDRVRLLENVVPDFSLPESALVDEDYWGAAVPIVVGEVKNYTPLYQQYMADIIAYELLSQTINVTASTKLFSRTSGSWITDGVIVGDYIITDGFANGGNNGTFKVTAVTALDITCGEATTLVDESGSGDESIICHRTGHKYILSGCVIESLDKVYTDNVELDTDLILFQQKDTSPPSKHAYGNFELEVFGPSTGSAVFRRYTIAIDSITALNSQGESGPDVGLATFKWSKDDGVTWEETGKLTWNLEAMPFQADKDNTGGATATIGGAYTSDVIRKYMIECTLGGEIGTIPYPKFKWSDDGGVTWSSEIEVQDTDPISMSHGLTVAFGVSDPIVRFEVAAYSFCPELGVGQCVGIEGRATTGGQTFYIKGPGDLGIHALSVSPQFSWFWKKDGDPDWTSELSPTGVAATMWKTLKDGFSIRWYDLRDYFDYSWEITATSMTPDDMDTGDKWEMLIQEQPIELENNVRIKFYPGDSGQDFYLNDEATFVLCSTMILNVDPDYTGTITCDVKGMVDKAGDFMSYPGEIIQALLENFADWPTSDIDTTKIAAFDVSFPYAVGYYSSGNETIVDVIDKILTGFPCFYSTDVSGKFVLEEIQVPSGDEDHTITEVEILDYPEGEILLEEHPTRRIVYNYDRNWNEVKNVSEIDQDRIEWLARDYRQVFKQDRRVQARYPLAVNLGPVDTCVVGREDAQALVDRVFDLLSVPHERIAITATAPYGLAMVGDKILVVRDKFDMDDGTLFLILGTDFDYVDQEFTLYLWR